ncbi:MAG: hypothetical protein M1831_002562 [Alyxoria varia]|nr:MAG: hypothetical protein M1831_002562 [Alyxoria varia]
MLHPESHNHSIDLHRRIAILETELKHTQCATRDGETANRFLLGCFARANMLGAPAPTIYHQAEPHFRFMNDPHVESSLYQRIAVLENELSRARSEDVARLAAEREVDDGFSKLRQMATNGRMKNSSASYPLPGRHEAAPVETTNGESAVLARIRELEETVTRLSVGPQRARAEHMAAPDRQPVQHHGEVHAVNQFRDTQPGHWTSYVTATHPKPSQRIQKHVSSDRGDCFPPEPPQDHISKRPKDEAGSGVQDREQSPPPRFINHFQYKARVDDAGEDEHQNDKESVLSETLSLGNPKREPTSARPVLVTEANAAALTPESPEQRYGPLDDSQDEYYQDAGPVNRSREPVGPGPLIEHHSRDGEQANCLVGSELFPRVVDLPFDFFDDSTARYTPPESMNDKYRTIMIGNVPATTTVANVTRHVRGGMLVSAELTNTSTITNGTFTARIMFFREDAARRYMSFRAKYPLYLPASDQKPRYDPTNRTKAYLTLVATPTYPLPQRTMTNILERGATRSLVIHNFPPHLSVSHIYSELSRGDYHDVHGIESVREDHSPTQHLKLVVTFTSVEKAGLAYARINNFRVFVPAKAWYVADPCAGPIEELHDIEGSAPAPSLRSTVTPKVRGEPPTAPRALLELQHKPLQHQKRPYSPPDFSKNFLLRSYPAPVTPRRSHPVYEDWDAPGGKRSEKVSGDELDYGDDSAPEKLALRLDEHRKFVNGMGSGEKTEAGPAAKTSGSKSNATAERRVAPVDYSDLYGPEEDRQPMKTTEQPAGHANPTLSDTDPAKPEFMTIRGPGYVSLVKKEAPNTTKEDDVLAEIKGANIPVTAEETPTASSDPSFADSISFDAKGNVIKHSGSDTGSSDREHPAEDTSSASSTQAPAPAPTTPASAFQLAFEKFKRSLRDAAGAGEDETGKDENVGGNDIDGGGGGSGSSEGKERLETLGEPGKESGEVSEEDRDRPGNKGPGYETGGLVLDY